MNKMFHTNKNTLCFGLDLPSFSHLNSEYVCALRGEAISWTVIMSKLTELPVVLNRYVDVKEMD